MLVRSTLLALVLLLVGCFGVPLLTPAPKARVQQFDPAEYEPYRGEGSATVAGEARVTRPNGEVAMGANSDITLVPRTPYGQEALDRAVIAGWVLRAPDPRLKAFVRRSRTDETGTFRFDRVPAGSYYVACTVAWEQIESTPLGRTVQPASAIAFASFELAEGETKHVIATR